MGNKTSQGQASRAAPFDLWGVPAPPSHPPHPPFGSVSVPPFHPETSTATAAPPSTKTLLRAIQTGNDDAALKLITQDMAGNMDELTQEDDLGRSPLMLACYQRRCDVVNALLRAGCDPNTQDKFGISPLCVAAFIGSLEMSAILVAKGGQVCHFMATGWSPISVAVANFQLDLVAYFLSVIEHGVQDATESVGMRAKARLALGPEVLAAILVSLAPLDSDKHLSRLTQKQRQDLSLRSTTLFITLNSDLLNKQVPLEVPSAVIRAAHIARLSLAAQRTAEEGANGGDCEGSAPFVPSKYSREGTLAHACALAASPRCLQLLVQAGCSLDSETSDGLTPLHLAQLDDEFTFYTLAVSADANVMPFLVNLPRYWVSREDNPKHRLGLSLRYQISSAKVWSSLSRVADPAAWVVGKAASDAATCKCMHCGIPMSLTEASEHRCPSGIKGVPNTRLVDHSWELEESVDTVWSRTWPQYRLGDAVYVCTPSHWPFRTDRLQDDTDALADKGALEMDTKWVHARVVEFRKAADVAEGRDDVLTLLNYLKENEQRASVGDEAAVDAEVDAGETEADTDGNGGVKDVRTDSGVASEVDGLLRRVIPEGGGTEGRRGDCHSQRPDKSSSSSSEGGRAHGETMDSERAATLTAQEVEVAVGKEMDEGSLEDGEGTEHEETETSSSSSLEI